MGSRPSVANGFRQSRMVPRFRCREAKIPADVATGVVMGNGVPAPATNLAKEAKLAAILP
jgi:hypothetical protein